MDLSSLFSLENKVALITGASKGIGYGIAEIFAAAGAKVVISSRKQDALDEMAAQLQSKGYEVTGIACNVGNMEELPVSWKKQSLNTVRLIFWSTMLLPILYLGPFMKLPWRHLTKS